MTRIIAIFTLCCALISCSKAPPIQAPVAKKIKKELTIHDDTRIDNYYWMRVSS